MDRLTPAAGEIEALLMRKIFPALALLIAVFGILPNASRAKKGQSRHASRVLSLPVATLEELRGEIAAGKRKDAALEQLRRDADAAFRQRSLSVAGKTCFQSIAQTPTF